MSLLAGTDGVTVGGHCGWELMVLLWVGTGDVTVGGSC